MAEWEDPELTCSHEHTKMKAIYRTAIYENNLKTSRKGFPQQIMWRRSHSKMARRSGDTAYSGLMPLGWRPTNGRDGTTAEVLPQEQRVWAPHWAFQPRGPTPGRWATRTSGFKSQWGLCLLWGTQRAIRNRACTKSQMVWDPVQRQ